MTAGVMRYTVIVRHPDTDQPTALLADEKVPDWASDLVHADDLKSAKADKAEAPAEKSDDEAASKPAAKSPAKK